MRYCRACKKTVPADAKVCPQCKKAEHIGTFGGGNPTKTAGGPVPVATSAEGEALRFTLGGLERQLEVGKKRSRWLALGAVLALIVGASAWIAHKAMTILDYATLDPNLRIERDALSPERLLIYYQPLDKGRLGFGRQDPDRETELVDRVASLNAGEQKFQWRWADVKTGDKLWVTHRSGWSLLRSELVVPEPPPRPKLGNAVVVGEIVDATTNTPVKDAEVRIIGTTLSARTDPDGKFRLIDAPTGPVNLEVSATNFSTDQIEKELVDTTENDVRIVLSPGLKTGQIRVVLTWGAQPQDLDAHLEGPLPDDRRFHIFFREKGDLQSKEFVNLDVDDTSSYGPETITILGVLPGKYEYYIHDYTNMNNRRSRALSRSGAQVKLYQGGQTYRFTANQNSPGTTWRVCTIEVGISGDVKVVKVDKYQ